MGGASLLIVSLLAASALAGQLRACSGDGSEGALLPHENCDQFYKCNYGVPVAQNCPPGLVYNTATTQCDWPEDVDCGDRNPPGSVPTPEQPTTEAPAPEEPAPETPAPEVPAPENPAPEEPAPEGPAPEAPAPVACPANQESSENILVAHEKCNKFYQCANGVPITFKCPSGLLYNTGNQRCDWPEKVDCSNRNPPGGAAPEQPAPPVDTPPLGPNGCPLDETIHWLMYHETDCSMFYKCVWGERKLASCPSQMAFNRELQVCDHPEQANCLLQPSAALNKHRARGA